MISTSPYCQISWNIVFLLLLHNPRMTRTFFYLNKNVNRRIMTVRRELYFRDYFNRCKNRLKSKKKINKAYTCVMRVFWLNLKIKKKCKRKYTNRGSSFEEEDDDDDDNAFCYSNNSVSQMSIHHHHHQHHYSNVLHI